MLLMAVITISAFVTEMLVLLQDRGRIKPE